MQNISKEQSHNLNDHAAIFFTKDGIIVDCISTSPIFKFSIIAQELNLEIENIYLDDNMLIVTCQFLPQPLNTRFCLYSIKDLLNKVNVKIQKLILRATHWMTWDLNTQYCSKCGAKLVKLNNLTKKKCNACASSFFPNLAPAIIVSITRKNEILLARSPHFKPGRYSIIAGFIELGEDVESAIHREVKEEVGIKITKLEYFASQSWPFPNSFMIAFKAEYLAGELKIDGNEIEDAKWFNINNLPELPAYPSISRALIDSVINSIK